MPLVVVRFVDETGVISCCHHVHQHECFRVADLIIIHTHIDTRMQRYVGNIGSGVTENALLSVFSNAGDVKFVRIQGDPSGASRFAFIEFSEQQGAIEGLKYNGTMIGDRPVKVTRAKNAVVKVSTHSHRGCSSIVHSHACIDSLGLSRLHS